jgi:hypothetical protein
VRDVACKTAPSSTDSDWSKLVQVGRVFVKGQEVADGKELWDPRGDFVIEDEG